MSERINARFGVLSQPVGPKKTVCQYRTTQPVTFNPLSVAAVNIDAEPDGRSVIRLQIKCNPQMDWSQTDLTRLSLYLSGDAPVTHALHLALTKRLASLYLRLPNSVERIRLEGFFSPGGFADEDSLWPKGDTAFGGWQLLLEYFTFREKFMFVHLNGLEKISFPEGIDCFEIEAVLTQQWDSELPVRSENIRLHCVPVINLFTIEADPLVVNGLESEYLLRPRRLQDGHTEIYAVDAVSGSQRTRNAVYAPFTSFRHKGGMMRRNAPERYYHTRVRRGVSGLYDTWLILGGDAWERDRLAEYETLSLKVTGTNGQLPRRALQSTLLNRCEQILQTPLDVRNLSKPTLPAYPPAEDRFHWRVLSHLGSSFLNMMASAEVLKGTLSLYNWQDDELNYRRLDAIMDVQQHEIQRFEKGFLLRGVDIEVTLDENGFTGEGDIHLFGEMLNRFFALYADIHLFNQLTLIIQPAGKSLRWKENHNQRLPGC